MDTKKALTDTAPLQEDIGYMASAIVQTYRTIQDCIAGHYPHFKVRSDTKIYPCVVTLENWHMHGPVMYGVFRDLVRKKMAEEGIPEDYLSEMPYSVWPASDFELGLQIMSESPIATVMDGKLLDKEKQEWEWRPYLSEKFRRRRKPLFEDDFRKLFADFNPV